MRLSKLYEAENSLPINRKERFYTGTVLPALIWSDRLDRFLRLIGAPTVTVRTDPADTNLVLYSEYDLRDAIANDQNAGWRLPDRAETPDLVIQIGEPDDEAGILVVVEAKVFSRPSPQSLRAQIERQEAAVIAPFRSVRPGWTVLQMALLPEQSVTHAMEAELRPLRWTTWQRLADAYRTVAAASYWVEVIEAALSAESWRRRRSELAISATRSGNAIVQHGEADGIRWVGRQGGFEVFITYDLGPDVRGGWVWQRRPYFVSREEQRPSANYFTLAQFLEAVRAEEAHGLAAP